MQPNNIDAYAYYINPKPLSLCMHCSLEHDPSTQIHLYFLVESASVNEKVACLRNIRMCIVDVLLKFE